MHQYQKVLQSETILSPETLYSPLIMMNEQKHVQNINYM